MNDIQSIVLNNKARERRDREMRILNDELKRLSDSNAILLAELNAVKAALRKCVCEG